MKIFTKIYLNPILLNNYIDYQIKKYMEKIDI